jgi:hypothetical protein
MTLRGKPITAFQSKSTALRTKAGLRLNRLLKNSFRIRWEYKILLASLVAPTSHSASLALPQHAQIRRELGTPASARFSAAC